jgi:type III pantothenate kinase
VDYPERVGIDRILAAWAATQLTSVRPLLVIQAGSAVTVDLLARQGDREIFAGGAIVPGLPMMLRLLGQAADLLPEIQPVELQALPPLPGKNTQAAMLSGVSSALVGGVQHLLHRYRSTFGAHIPAIISGGDGPDLICYLEQPCIESPQLVMQGLRLLASRLDQRSLCRNTGGCGPSS